MVNQDFGYRLKQLSDRISALEDRILVDTKSIESEDWDTEMLMRKWKISKRTAANYRKQGLVFYKRGGRVFYTPESRENFLKKGKDVRYGNS